MRSLLKHDPAKPFQLVKFLSWSSLILILASSMFLVAVLGNYAKRTVLQKDEEFALLLAENLNHQIYQRFTLPTVLGFGRVRLRDDAQYERLDQVVQSTIHGFKVLQVRVLDLQGQISYSTDQDELGQEAGSSSVQEAIKEGERSFDVLDRRESKWAFWRFSLPEESYVLRTTFPLRTERSLGAKHQEPIVGILQFTQDVTRDYETIAYFQLLIVVVVLCSSGILFLLLYMIILRADRILGERFQEKEKLERRLHQNEKLASMGRMLASISHEIRNPLGVIQSSAELLSKRAGNQEGSTQKLAKAIYEEAQRLSRTVNDFLDYARPKQPRLQDINLSGLLQQCLVFFESELQKKGVQVDWNLPDEVQVRGDSDLLYRAFFNLLANALQAMPESGGRLGVTWQEEEKQLIIQDSGPGFDSTLQDTYLEPFYTTKDSGTGLGLAIVQNILQNHGASLQLGTAPEGGGQVVITFKGL
ncbi:MAG: histidine kinase dimerization/phospho-acceptor domain-containing protein [Desulfohalobiaceae bacterium]